MNTHGVTLMALKVCSALFVLSGFSRILRRRGRISFAKMQNNNFYAFFQIVR